MQTTRDMTEPLEGTKPIDWRQTCDEVLGKFKQIAGDAPPGHTATKLAEFGELLTWTLVNAPVADDARYRAPTTIGGKATY